MSTHLSTAMPEIESIVRSLEDASISEDLEPSRCLILFAAYGQGDPTPIIGINQVAAFKVPFFLYVIFWNPHILGEKSILCCCTVGIGMREFTLISILLWKFNVSIMATCCYVGNDLVSANCYEDC